MKTKTSELTGVALDWAIAKQEYVEVEYLNDGITQCLLRVSPFTGIYAPSTDWAQGGPIIEREGIALYRNFEDATTEFGKEITLDHGWAAHITPRRYWQTPRARSFGPTPLIAAMRCYVASRLGDQVEIPEEIL